MALNNASIDSTQPSPVAIAEGDGIGPEIMAATLAIIEAADAPLDLRHITIGEQVYKSGNTSGIPDEAWDVIRETGVMLKAPITTPQGGGYKSLNVSIRKTLGLFANIRPCVAYHPFTATNFPGMDLVVVRENEEDTYGGIEHQQTPEVVQCLKLITWPGSLRLCQYAFAYAKAHGRNKVTCFVKDNIMKQSDGLFRKAFEQVAKQYPEIELSHMYVDNAAMQLCRWPKQFDVMLCGNMFGDILSDEAAMLTGSLGMLPSASLAEGSFGLYEPSGGSAPDIAGQGVANPIAQILSAAMMLRYSFGLTDAADAVEKAVEKALNDGFRTGDIYQGQPDEKKVNTREMGDAIIARL